MYTHLTGSTQFNDFEVQCDSTLHFTETYQTVCYNVTIYDDAVCEYENEYFLIQIVFVEGSSAVDIDLEYGHTTVYIDDTLEPECGIYICTSARVHQFTHIVFALNVFHI